MASSEMGAGAALREPARSPGILVRDQILIERKRHGRIEIRLRSRLSDASRQNCQGQEYKNEDRYGISHAIPPLQKALNCAINEVGHLQVQLSGDSLLLKEHLDIPPQVIEALPSHRRPALRLGRAGRVPGAPPACTAPDSAPSLHGPAPYFRIASAISGSSVSACPHMLRSHASRIAGCVRGYTSCSPSSPPGKAKVGVNSPVSSTFTEESRDRPTTVPAHRLSAW